VVSAEAQAIRYSSEPGASPVQTFQLQALLPVTYGRLTLLGIAAAARSREDRGGFGLGGFLNLSGTPVGAVSGSQAALVGGLAYYRVGELPRALGRSIYAGVSLEAGNVWKRRSDMAFGDLRKATSLFLGLDTIIGPLYFGWGHTFGGDSALYLFLGRPTGTN
jgi:NTE family protein